MKPSSLTLVALVCVAYCAARSMNDDTRDQRTILVCLVVHRDAHTLPHFLDYFQKLDYPKEKMHLWIHVEGHRNDLVSKLRDWSARNSYRHEIRTSREGDEPIDSKAAPERVQHVAGLKEEALLRARQLSVDYAWFLDCDVLLTERKTLKNLVASGRPIVAPLLQSSRSGYLNFQPGPLGRDFIWQKKMGDCHLVAMVHNCILIDLHQTASAQLSFLSDKTDTEPAGDLFGTEKHLYHSAQRTDVSSWVCIFKRSGVVLDPLRKHHTVPEQAKLLLETENQLGLQLIRPRPPLSEQLPTLLQYNLGLDEMFFVNLDREPVRRDWTIRVALNEGFHLKRVSAVDGKTLIASGVDSWGIRLYDSLLHCPLENGTTLLRHLGPDEIGSTLSHYGIWKEMVERNLDKAVIFEDDVVFEKNGRQKLADLVDELQRLDLDWDLVYLQSSNWQKFVADSKTLMTVHHNSGHLGYLLSNRGARKLVQGGLLDRFIPSDAYINVMMNQRDSCNSHLVEEWPKQQRTLRAYCLLKHLVRHRDDSLNLPNNKKSVPSRHSDGIVDLVWRFLYLLAACCTAQWLWTRRDEIYYLGFIAWLQSSIPVPSRSFGLKKSA